MEPAGYAVNFYPIYAGDDEPNPDAIVDVDAEVHVSEHFENPPTLWYDDTFDLRSRWFPTMDEAYEYRDALLASIANPLPWESFFQL